LNALPTCASIGGDEACAYGITETIEPKRRRTRIDHARNDASNGRTPRHHCTLAIAPARVRLAQRSRTHDKSNAMHT
jgi:hypothetical protein